jgi:hypothetical protein
MSTVTAASTIPAEPGTPAPAPDTPPSASGKRQPTCGPLLDSLAANFRMHPYDAALAIGSLLGNIAGPHAGFVTPEDELVRPGLNLLHVDDGHAAPHSLMSALVQPLRARAQMIRERAASLNRTIVDQHTFGIGPVDHHAVTGGEPLMVLKQRSAAFNDHQEKLAQMDQFPFDPFRYGHMADRYNFARVDIPWAASAPGINHLPSLFAERLDLNHVPRLLQESLHREAFLYHPAGGLCGRSDLFSSKQEELAGRITSWLQGQDMQFPPVHARQGHGTFATGRISLWTATDQERLAGVLSRSRSHWNDVLQQCLLWSRSDVPEPAPSNELTGLAHDTYHSMLHDVMELRCHGSYERQRRLMVGDSEVDRYRKLKRLFLERINEVDAQDRPYVVQFHDLLERMLWVVMQFNTREHPIDYLGCAGNVAYHALRMQVRLLKQAREAAEVASLNAQTVFIVRTLGRHGAMTLRDLQRSSNNQRKAVILPSLELLQQRGLVRQDDQRRFCLISTETGSPVPAPTNLPLSQ